MAPVVAMLSSILLLFTGAGAATLRRRSGADPAINDVAPVSMDASDQGVQLFRQSDPDPNPLTLFCFMVVMPNTDEVGLLKLHMKRRMLTGCNDWVVMSNVSSAEELVGPQSDEMLPSAEILTSRHYVQGITGPMERVRKDMKVQGSDVMVQAWKTLFASKSYQRFNFVARVDPDLVLFPHRLAAVLESFRYISSVLLFDGGKECSVERGGLAVMSRGLMDRVGKKLGNETLATGSVADHPTEDQMLINITKETDNGFVWYAPNMVQSRVFQCRKAPWRAAYHKFGHANQMRECLAQLHEVTQKQPMTKDEFFQKCALDHVDQHNPSAVSREAVVAPPVVVKK